MRDDFYRNGLPVKSIQPDLFMPSPITAGLKRFAVIGDAGSGNGDQKAIADAMARTFQKTPFASVLVLGDNVYEDGEPWRFKERIQAPYQDLLDEGVKFYPVMGNHDVRQGYGGLQTRYWGVPEFYNFRIRDTEFFALDTTVFLPGYDDCYSDNIFAAKRKAHAQLLWLDRALSRSKAKFKVVYGHYPVYATWVDNLRRKRSTEAVRAILEPVLVKHGVDLYLAGHEHHYEKTKPVKGVTYFISGAAGKMRETTMENDPGNIRDKRIARFHFMLFEMTSQGLKYQAIGKSGKVLDEGLIPPKRQTQLRFA